MGMFLRRGPAPKRMRAVTIDGTFSSSKAYATIDDTMYISAATVDVAPGTVIGIRVSSDSFNHAGSCYIAVDGETVQAGRGTYLYTVLKDSSITFFRGGSSGDYYYYCVITTT